MALMNLAIKTWGTCKSAITNFTSPLIGISLRSPQKKITEVIANMIRDEARMQAYKLLAKSHRSAINTILWQNGLLLTSILPVHFFHSAIPFYIAYACVACYSVISVVQSWPQLKMWALTGSLITTIKCTVHEAILADLCQRHPLEQAVVQYLGPDLENVSNEIASEILPDIRAALINMGLTLIMAFIAFRLTAIPLLEHRAF